MKFQSQGTMLCTPVDEEAKGLVRALHAALQISDPTFQPAGLYVGPETLAVTNRLGFSFSSCQQLTADIEDVVEMIGGGMVLDPASGKMVVKKSGFPWWGWLLMVGGAAAAWNYTQPKGKRWF